MFDKTELAGIAEALAKVNEATGTRLGDSELYLDMEPMAVKDANNGIVGFIEWDDGFVGFRPAVGKAE